MTGHSLRHPRWNAVAAWTALAGTIACGAPAIPRATSVTPPVMMATGPSLGLCPTPAADQLALLVARSITAKDSGKTLSLHETDRFSVYLEDSRYPLGELQASPGGLLGTISNGSIRGPNCYPIMYEATGQGQLVLEDRDFRLEIVIDDASPRSSLPLP